MTTALTFKIQLLEKKGRNNTFVGWTSHCTESWHHAALNPVTLQRANTIFYHYTVGIVRAIGQVHTFWRGAQQESMTDRLTLFSTRLYDFILFNSRYFMHFDDWWACLWVSKWWERSLFRWKVLQIDELHYAMFLSQTSIISIQIPW